jgi:hypothetical protein
LNDGAVGRLMTAGTGGHDVAARSRALSRASKLAAYESIQGPFREWFRVQNRLGVRASVGFLRRTETTLRRRATPVLRKPQSLPMKSLNALRLIAIVALAAFGYAYAADNAAPAAKEAGCCAKAAKDGKACTHGCCVEANKAGKNCERCGGSGEMAKPAAKK